METRQKLTLGIAAIFMVTLTIIGVTYAYFVTTISVADGAADETVIVTETAEIGASFAAGVQPVSIINAIPGDDVYKAWAVNNTGDAATSVALTLRTTATGDVEFAHTLTTQATTANKAYSAYDNIEVSLVSVDATTAGGSTDAFFAKTQEDLEDMYATAEETTANVIQTAVNAPYTGTTINLGTGLQPVAQSGTNYYILKVKYKDNFTNQNAENNASVNVIPDISATRV